MRRILSVFILTASLSGLLSGAAAWAQDNNAAGGGTTAPQSTTEVHHGMGDAIGAALSLTPRVGSFGYETANQTYSSRIIEGFTANFNFVAVTGLPSILHFGIESGILYSHLGSSDANWFGSNSSQFSTEDANMFLVPITLQMGVRPTDTSLVALNLGAQFLDRSIGNSMFLGRPGDLNTGTATDFFPSVGLNLSWDVGPTIAASLRGDAIPTPTAVSYTAMFGLVFGIV